MASGPAVIINVGTDTSAVAPGIQKAETAVRRGAANMERAGAQVGRGFERGARTVAVNGRKTGAAVTGLAADLATGADATTAITSAMLMFGRGLRGGLFVAALAGGVTYLSKKFSGLNKEIEASDKRLKKLAATGELKNLSEDDLLKNLKAQRENADANKPGGITGRIKDFFDPGRKAAFNSANTNAANTYAALSQQLEGGNKVNHLKATGRASAAKKAEFKTKEAVDRQSLIDKLTEAKAAPGEIDDAVATYDAGAKDRRKLAGVGGINGRAPQAKPRGSNFSGLDKLKTLQTRGPQNSWSGGLESLETLKHKDKEWVQDPMPMVGVSPQAKTFAETGGLRGNVIPGNRNPTTGQLLMKGADGLTLGLPLIRTAIKVLEMIQGNTAKNAAPVMGK